MPRPYMPRPFLRGRLAARDTDNSVCKVRRPRKSRRQLARAADRGAAWRRRPAPFCRRREPPKESVVKPPVRARHAAEKTPPDTGKPAAPDKAESWLPPRPQFLALQADFTLELIQQRLV